MKFNVIKYTEGGDSWTKWIKKRIDNNLNLLKLTTGPTGIGKSYVDISIAYKIDPDFSIDQICFSTIELMEMVNKFNDTTTELSKKKYKQLIFEEIQYSASSREWQSKTNKLLNYVLSTFRHQNIILFFNTPYVDFVDSTIMKLCHALFECRGWSKRTGLSNVRAKILQYNPAKKKTYHHSLYVIKDKTLNKLPFIKVPKPPKHLIDAYEAKKTKFTTELNKRVYRELISIENKPKEGRKALTERQKEVMELIAEFGITQAQEKLGISLTAVYEHKKLAELKGYEVQEFKKEG